MMRVYVNRFQISFFLMLAIWPTLGCSKSNGNTPPQPAPPTITSQPESRVVVEGQTAAFRVVASGSAPFTYQWKWNGLVVSGAVLDTFSTPPTVTSDNQSVLSVEVKNKYGIATSATASLLIENSPYPPRLGDLRFKDVCAFPIPLQVYQITNIIGGTSRAFPNQIGTPLELSAPGPKVPLDTSWSVVLFTLPDGAVSRSTMYLSGYQNDLTQAVTGITSPHSLIGSLDICENSNAFAFQVIQTSAPEEYTFASKTVPIDGLSVSAAQEGETSRVITAVSFNQGAVTYFSYGWSGDISTTYDTKVSFSDVDTVRSEAVNLAQQGYIITAMGGNTVNGFILVGTRAKGDNRSRSLVVWSPTGTASVGRGYSYVGHIFVPSKTNPSNGTELWFLEQ